MCESTDADGNLGLGLDSYFVREVLGTALQSVWDTFKDTTKFIFTK